MKWYDLSMTDKAKYIRLGVNNGITDLKTIRNTYNKYAEGGNLDGEVFENDANKGAILSKFLQAKISRDKVSKIDNSNDYIIGGTKNYGWDNDKDRNSFTKDRLARAINPSGGINFLSLIPQGHNYIWDNDVSAKAGDLDKAFWKRHLGYPRDTVALPYTNVRFKGDYDNREKYKNKEYIGLNKNLKKAILEGIEDGEITIDNDLNWTPKKETKRGRIPDKHEYFTTPLGNFSIRENNGSGIYDVFDTYDFPSTWWFPNLNRKSGYEMEIRDTIHSKNAIPSLYNPMYTKAKKK